MTTQLQAVKMDETNTETTNPSWKSLYRVGGVAALGTVLVGLVEIGITFLPGGNTPYETVFDWFTLFQNNWFMGLRNLGLLNILFYGLGHPDLFCALWRSPESQSNTRRIGNDHFLHRGGGLLCHQSGLRHARSQQPICAGDD